MDFMSGMSMQQQPKKLWKSIIERIIFSKRRSCSNRKEGNSSLILFSSCQSEGHHAIWDGSMIFVMITA